MPPAEHSANAQVAAAPVPALTQVADDRYPSPEAWIAIFTLLLVMATVWLATVTTGLLREAKKQFPFFRENVAAAKMAAEAARDNAAAMARSQRAFLFPVPKPRDAHYITDPEGDRVGQVMRLFARNIGQTGATITSVCWDVVPLKQLPSEPRYPAPNRVLDVVQGASADTPTKAPHVEYRYFWCHDAHETRVVFGRIEYEDVFGKAHSTRFLYKIALMAGTDSVFEHLSVDGFPAYIHRD